MELSSSRNGSVLEIDRQIQLSPKPFQRTIASNTHKSTHHSYYFIFIKFISHLYTYYTSIHNSFIKTSITSDTQRELIPQAESHRPIVASSWNSVGSPWEIWMGSSAGTSRWMICDDIRWYTMIYDDIHMIIIQHMTTMGFLFPQPIFTNNAFVLRLNSAG